ncbi:hypothetical protein CWE09_12705 [Aliidiomarina minuta]|uniref:Uncharacterized protein n=1 Tax=Aliidiomarina minuta TaxID=880057 RepID=A0A432W3U5_9GAMM|nr:hypothetical protein [Aliidiomarina minuta]RUO24002.1 hypothetical protein CWE09_12705 [Aliidiomarina minuta]
MRGLFYQHRPWQKLNCLTAFLAALMVLFFHGILNLLSTGRSALTADDSSLTHILSSSEIHRLLSESDFWIAQVQGFFSIFSNIGLWLHIVWLPVSIALIIVIRGLCTLTGRPRWQASIFLMVAGSLALHLIHIFISPAATLNQLAAGPAVALYFSLAAFWASASRLRGPNSH